VLLSKRLLEVIGDTYLLDGIPSSSAPASASAMAPATAMSPRTLRTPTWHYPAPKNDSRGTFSFRSRNGRSRPSAQIEIDLRAAIQNDVLRPLLSALIGSFHRRITGFEAARALADPERA